MVQPLTDTELATLAPKQRQMVQRFKGRGVIRRPIPGKCRYYSIRYCVNGKQHEESTKSERVSDAVEMLNKRLGTDKTAKASKLTFEKMVEELAFYYEVNHRTASPMVTGVNGLKTTFAGWPAHKIDKAAVQMHIKRRVKEGYANGTVNRELSYLRQMFNLVEFENPPKIKKLQESTPRAGFFERAQLDAVLAHIDPALRDLMHVAYITGWRVLSEITTRQWSHVDWSGRGSLRLDPGETKNKAGRNFPLLADLRAILERRLKATKLLEQHRGLVIPWIFYRDAPVNHTPVTKIIPIRDSDWYYDSWHDACQAAGIDRYPHDFRRTAVRNLEMGGVPTKDAMAMVGHKTMAIYIRYSIADSRSMEAAAVKMDAHHEQMRGAK